MKYIVFLFIAAISLFSQVLPAPMIFVHTVQSWATNEDGSPKHLTVYETTNLHDWFVYDVLGVTSWPIGEGNYWNIPAGNYFYVTNNSYPEYVQPIAITYPIIFTFKSTNNTEKRFFKVVEGNSFGRTENNHINHWVTRAMYYSDEYQSMTNY